MAKASEELKNRILCYINSYTEQHGFAPSYREIQAAVGVGSTSTRGVGEPAPEFVPMPSGRWGVCSSFMRVLPFLYARSARFYPIVSTREPPCGRVSARLKK